MALGALFYPKGTEEKPIKFDELYIPYIYKEIYLEGIYVDLFNMQKDRVVMDVGANIGCTVQYFRDFSKKIYAIEPSPEHYEALVKNKEFNGWDNVETFNVAIADKDGEMMLNQNPSNRTCHSLTLDYKQGGTMVKTVAFDTFFEQNKIEKIDFCKFDVEGMEKIILPSLSFEKIHKKINSIMVEFHLPDWKDLVKLMIEKYGFDARRYNSSAIVVLFVKN
jgi:FkbM family methyltransferase